MAGIARLVVPGCPHHVTQRGNRRQEVFFQDADYEAYLALLSEWADRAETRVWAYCLMPNHLHLILVPSREDGLRATLGETHRRYTRLINFREGWRGHLWQERFHSFVMDETYLLLCARYVELNPVAAGLVARPEQWRWSSTRAHLSAVDNEAVEADPLLERMPDWAGFLESGIEPAMVRRLETHAQTGRPLGTPDWLEALEQRLGQRVRPRPAGRPRKEL